jgi:2-C-methyl-D-erythritol 4-phosphate cytidylyltransferase
LPFVSPRVGVILPAAGRSARFGGSGPKKPFASLAGKAVWLHAAERFIDRPEVIAVAIVIAAEDREFFLEKFGGQLAMKGISIAAGGAERSDSVKNGLATLPADVDFVAVHDAARPCVDSATIDRTFQAAFAAGAAIAAVPSASTLKRASRGSADQAPLIAATLPRDDVWLAQTPQVFRRDWYEEALNRHGHERVTDDAQWLERLGKPVALVRGSDLNLKITTQDDLILAEAILQKLHAREKRRAFHPFKDDFGNEL